MIRLGFAGSFHASGRDNVQDFPGQSQAIRTKGQEAFADFGARYSTTSTAAPRMRPARRRPRASLAAARGKASTSVRTDARGAMARNSSPSRRVRLATERLPRWPGGQLVVSGAALVWGRVGLARQRWLRIMALAGLAVVANAPLLVVPAERSAARLAEEGVAAGGLNVVLALLAMAAGVLRPSARPTTSGPRC